MCCDSKVVSGIIASLSELFLGGWKMRVDGSVHRRYDGASQTCGECRYNKQEISGINVEVD